VYRLSIVLALAGLGLVLLSISPGPPPGADSDTAPNAEAAPSAPRTGAEDWGKASGPADLASRGRALFQAKGCTACHQHREVNPGAGVAIGPDLTDRSFDPDYLRIWLADPASVRPGTFMPNLGLSAEEIEGLIAFINDGGG
jgi:cytochrome c2